MRRLPTALLSVTLVVPVVLAVPVFTRSTPRPHAVAPQVSTWNATNDLQSAAAARTSSRGAVTGTVHHATSFSTVGVRWANGTIAAGSHVQVRTRDGSSAWSDWTTADPDDAAPDPGSPDAKSAAQVDKGDVVSAPLFAGTSDQVQARVVSGTGGVVTAPSSLQVLTVNPGTSAADDAIGDQPASSAAAASATPAIYTRADWGADESLRSHNVGCANPIYMSTVKAAIIHHTDGENDYSADEVPSLIRAIYAYHVLGEGWCDIGYNFLVDRFGRTWEGRYGGTTRAILGSHSGGFNTYTMGVAVLGTYVSTAASPQAISAIQQLTAWKLGLFHDNPSGKVTLTSAGTQYTAYPAGTRISINTISGHRDVDQTDCPGQSLYNQLPTIRAGASSLLGTGLVGPVIAPGAYGASATFSAGLTTAANWSFTVTSSAGATLRTISGSASTGLQGSWNGRDSAGNLLPIGSYTATLAASGIGIASAAVPYALSFAVTNHPGDLGLVDVNAGTVQAAIVSQTSNYQSYDVNAATAIAGIDPAQWQFFYAPYLQDGQADLWAVRTAGGSSENVELHVLSAASGYQSFLLHKVLPIPTVDPAEWTFRAASFAGDGARDLFAIRTTGGSSGQVEVHVLSEASGYATFVDHAATALAAQAVGAGTFLVGDSTGSGNLVFVLRAGASGNTEVHILQRAGGYKSFALHAATPLTSTTGAQYQFSLADVNADGVPDLALTLLQGGSQGKVEVHVLNGATAFRSFLTHQATGVAALDPASWTAGLLG